MPNSCRKPTLRIAGFLVLLFWSHGVGGPVVQSGGGNPGQSRSLREANMKQLTVEPLEPPKQEDPQSRYWIATHIRAYDTLGYASTGGKKLQWLRLQGFDATEEN